MKKLQLNRETIRNLQESEMVAVAAGSPPGGTTPQCAASSLRRAQLEDPTWGQLGQLKKFVGFGR